MSFRTELELGQTPDRKSKFSQLQVLTGTAHHGGWELGVSPKEHSWGRDECRASVVTSELPQSTPRGGEQRGHSGLCPEEK